MYMPVLISIIEINKLSQSYSDKIFYKVMLNTEILNYVNLKEEVEKILNTFFYHFIEQDNILLS